MSICRMLYNHKLDKYFISNQQKVQDNYFRISRSGIFFSRGADSHMFKSYALGNLSPGKFYTDFLLYEL